MIYQRGAIIKEFRYLRGLLNGRANGLGNELLDQLLELTGALLGHDLKNLLADRLDLSGRGVVGLPQAVLALLSERNAEKTKLVAISSGDVKMRVNERLPLLHQGANLVSSEIHTVELGLGGAVVNIKDFKLELPVKSILILVQVSKVRLNNAALESLRGNVGSFGARNDGLANVAMGENGGSLKVIPFLLLEGINGLLSLSLLAFGKALVLAYCHAGTKCKKLDVAALADLSTQGAVCFKAIASSTWIRDAPAARVPKQLPLHAHRLASHSPPPRRWMLQKGGGCVRNEVACERHTERWCCNMSKNPNDFSIKNRTRPLPRGTLSDSN